MHFLYAKHITSCDNCQAVIVKRVIVLKKVIVISGEKRTKLPRLTTTHCREGAKPAFIGVPAEINGEKAIAFMKGGEIVSYITMLEIMDKLYIENKMIAEVDF